MQELREVRVYVVHKGRVGVHELRVVLSVRYDNGKIDRAEADFLVELRNRMRYRTEAFEQFFSRTLADYLLADGRLGREETAWLRQRLFPDGLSDDAGRRLLELLQAEARLVCPEFAALCAECVPPRPRGGRAAVLTR
jgi:hypothetical protein